MKNVEKLKTMKMEKLILMMSLPAMVSMLVQALYNIVDSIFVAKIGEEALAAISLAFPIQMVIIAFFAGLGVGVNVYMSRKLGENNLDKAVSTAEHGIVIGIFLWLILAILSFFLPRLFVGLFTNDPLIIDYTVKYLSIVMLFSFGSIITEVCMSVTRATGNPLSSMKIQLLGAITNIILDPILIFGFMFIKPMGITGAAIATVIGQIISMIYGLYIVNKSCETLNLNPKKFHYNKKIIKSIFKVGIPAMLMTGLSSVMLTGINIILASFSALSIVAFGAYYKLQSFILMPVLGLTQGSMPIISYNYGAKDQTRVKSAIIHSFITATAIMLFGTLIFNLFPKELLSLFNATKEMLKIGIPCLRLCSASFIFVGFNLIISTVFQSIEKSKLSLFIALGRQVVLLLPLAYLLGYLMNVNGIWVSFIVTEVACSIFGFIKLYKIHKNDSII